MNFDLHFPDAEGVTIILAWTAAWIGTLALILSRRDFDSVTRLTWVVVVIFVPIFGVFLYAFIAPEREDVKKGDQVDDLYGTPWKNDPGYTAKSASRET
jgi:hypothetical protein